MKIESFKGAAVECSIDGMPIYVLEISRDDANILSKKKNPGNESKHITNMGPAGIVDHVTCLLTPKEIEKFREIKNKRYEVFWSHPLLKPSYMGYVEAFTANTGTTISGYAQCSFTIEQCVTEIENFDIYVSVSAPAKAATAKAAKSEAMAKVPTKETLVDNGATEAAADVFADDIDGIDSAWNVLETNIDTMETSEISFAEISKSLELYSGSIDAYLTNNRGIYEYIGSDAAFIEMSLLNSVQHMRESIEGLAYGVDNAISIMTDQETDLPSIMDAFGVSMDLAATVMTNNKIDDPFCIMPGKKIVMNLNDAQ